ncbi:amidohydrolase family protein [Rhodohalobacter sp. 614A]|uniref:amidohydrolase family protein n=1 Tax=Rhodohalobacter sp. 614A TaxID=2908649 RepID=UPI001F3A7F7E|nr:amidohydrolase family protein [Rhodohalobacter sp. 614A]
MKIRNIVTGLFAFAIVVTSGVISNADAQIAVKGETVYTVSGSAIQDGVVLVRDGKIEAVGSADDVDIPGDYDVHEAKIVTPGLIDARTVVGLAGYYNQDHDQDQLETSNAVQPELRAIDSYNAREFLVNFLMKEGITTIHTGHGPGAVISGQTMIAKTSGQTVEESLVDSSTTLAVTFGPSVERNFDSPGTRAKAVAVLRQDLIKAQDYAEKRAAGEDQSRDLKMEALADLLDGKITALMSAHTSHDIMTALRIQREFGFPMMLEGASEAYLVLDEIKEADIPVIIHPLMIRPYGESKNASMETPAKLKKAGIPFAFQSGYEGYVPKTRVAKFEAAIAAANELGFDNTLYALTLGAAEILGIDERVGSLEEGKDADIVLFDGDPFEYVTHVEGVIINGEVVYEGE